MARPRDTRARRLSAGGCLLLGGGLAIAVLDLPDRAAGLRPSVDAAMGRSGVEHEVTAVLLNFRAYDTWLEVGVLLLAVIGVLTLQRSDDLAFVAPERGAGEVLRWFVRLTVPALVLGAGYLLWLGTSAPGGAFQAGAVAGAAGILLALALGRGPERLGRLTLAAGLLAGFVGFGLVAALPVLAGEPMLRLPPAAAGTTIVAVELGVAASTAVTLAALFAGAAPARR